MSRLTILLILAVATAGCTRDASTPAAAVPPPSAPRTISLAPLELPVRAGAQPDLVAAPDGSLLLSWIEKHAGGGHSLRFSRMSGERWSTPRTIATGSDWFVNWADTPHIAATADGALWAHWLRKSAAATYAYDVVLSRSADGGDSWSPPFRVNDDGTRTEHGFVSVWPAARDELGIAWLDGRRTGGAHDHHGGGMMTLRSARFDGALARHDEMEVDASTCDCCQTAVAITARGPLLVYRDRTVGEIRDISAARWQDAAWTQPRAVHADGWKMPACPVNGPSAEARGTEVRVAWYTAADGGVPEIRHARSGDAGDTFDAPLTVDRGPEVLGRVTTALDGDATWIAWLREDDSGQSLWAARIAGEPARVEQRLRVATLRGRGRGTGVPQLVAGDGRLHLVWTDLVEGAPRLHGASLVLR